MKGMERIPQEESEDKDKDKIKKDICKKCKIFEKKCDENSFSKTIMYFVIVQVIGIILLSRSDILKDLKKRGNENEETKNTVKLALYINSLSVGEIERFTSLLINYLSKQPIFDIYLFYNKDCEDEYYINSTVHKIKINLHSTQILRTKLVENNIELFLYQFDIINDIKMLNKLSEIKDITTIFINYSSFLYWIYNNDLNSFTTLYDAYRKSNYIISLIPYENDLLFKKWGIDSIFMNIIMPHDINYTTPLDLSSNTILMLGKGPENIKRFGLGIKTMEYIKKEIPDCKMKIVTDLNEIKNLKKLAKELNLENSITFEEYSFSNDKYFNDISLHLLPSIAEGIGLDICETKLFGIPNVLVGLDYLPCSKGGVSIIYEDNPNIIAKECIKILKDENYRKQLGKEAFESMRKYNNDDIGDKWMRLILSTYLDNAYYHRIQDEDKDLRNIKEDEEILNNQVNLLRNRIKGLKNLNNNNIKDFDFMKKLNKIKVDNSYFF